MKSTTQRICAVAVGIALFAALSMCLQVPVFENYYLCLGYAVMAVYCYTFGAMNGILTGSLGAAAYCLLINGLRGMPGWALGNVVIGAALGWTFARTKHMKIPAATAIDAVVIVASTALGILIVKSVVESVIYAQMFAVRIGKNIFAFAADAVMLLVSLPICRVMDAQGKKLFPQLAKGR